jgi:hypothetical protein
MDHPLLSLYSDAIVGVMGLGPTGCFRYTIRTHVHGAVVGCSLWLCLRRLPDRLRLGSWWFGLAKGYAFVHAKGGGAFCFGEYMYEVLKDNSLYIFMPWKGGVFKGVGVFSRGWVQDGDRGLFFTCKHLNSVNTLCKLLALLQFALIRQKNNYDCKKTFWSE